MEVVVQFDAKAEGQKGALDGIRVLDFGRFLAAPHCALQLQCMGADVIKIERPVVGDDGRAFGYFYREGFGGYFLQQNWGKKSLSVNLKDPRGVDIVKQLVKCSDVVVENFRPGTMEALGLGYKELSDINPRLVMCSISAYGQTGPYALKPGFGSLVEALACLPELTGEPDGAPMPTLLPVADLQAASQATGAICAALFHRERTGLGQYIDVALLDCVFEMHEWAIQQYVGSKGEIQMTRRGLKDPWTVPWGHFKIGDGSYIVLNCANEKLWGNLCKLLGKPELAKDPRFNSNEARQRHKDEVYRLIDEWMGSIHSRDEALKALREQDIPCEPVQNVAEMVNHPQIRARGMLRKMDHPILGEVTMVNVAPKMSLTPMEISGVAPLLGQHNREVLQGVLGYTLDEISRLEDERVLYSEPLVRELSS